MKHLNTFVIYPYLPIVIGALLGAALGYFGQCSSGICPLTSTWWRGAIYGTVMGALFFFSSHGTTAPSAKESLSQREKDRPASREQ